MSQDLWTHIRTVTDFPKAGIEFYDISPLLNRHLNQLIDALIHALPSDILVATDAFVAVESRGFVLASLLAARLDKGLILIRKTGKLPPSDTLEISCDLDPANVLLVDDVLATGGTLVAADKLCKTAGLTALGSLVLLDLTELHGDLGLKYWCVLSK